MCGAATLTRKIYPEANRNSKFRTCQQELASKAYQQSLPAKPTSKAYQQSLMVRGRDRLQLLISCQQATGKSARATQTLLTLAEARQSEAQSESPRLEMVLSPGRRRHRLLPQHRQSFGLDDPVPRPPLPVVAHLRRMLPRRQSHHQVPRR
jgi:hypothetical protein